MTMMDKIYPICDISQKLDAKIVHNVKSFGKFTNNHCEI